MSDNKKLIDVIAGTAVRPMKAKDVERLKVKGWSNQHLARYEKAHEKGVDKVSDVSCPWCGAHILTACGK